MEKSCGFIAYKTIENVNYYLLIMSINGDIGFPKGHVEAGESEIQTAIREIKEETNIEVNPVPGFMREIQYKMPSRKNTVKQVVYFLGECTTNEIICQPEEITDAGFFKYEDALRIITFEDSRKLLLDAEEFIRSKN